MKKDIKKNVFTEKILSGEAYVLAENWKADLEFYKDELNFLNSLINKYFVFLINDHQLKQIQNLVDQLVQNLNLHTELNRKIDQYMSTLQSIISEKPKTVDISVVNEHEKLEKDLMTFLASSKILKKKIFSIAEEMLEHKNVKKLEDAHAM
jgi:hypothetical protein